MLALLPHAKPHRSSPSNSRLMEAAGTREKFGVHEGQLGAGGGDLLDSQFAEFRLELAQLLREVLLALGPELAGFDLCGRL